MRKDLPRCVKYPIVQKEYNLTKEELRAMGIRPSIGRKYDTKLIDACLDKISGLSQDITQEQLIEDILIKRAQHGNLQSALPSC